MKGIRLPRSQSWLQPMVLQQTRQPFLASLSEKKPQHVIGISKSSSCRLLLGSKHRIYTEWEAQAGGALRVQGQSRLPRETCHRKESQAHTYHHWEVLNERMQKVDLSTQPVIPVCPETTAGSLQLQGLSGLQKEFKATLGKSVRIYPEIEWVETTVKGLVTRGKVLGSIPSKETGRGTRSRVTTRP